MTAPDVVVIGGGIIGVAASAFLAEGGANVTLVEREALAAGASGRNSGVVQHPFDPALVPLYEETVAQYRALADLVPETGFRLAVEPAGLLLVSHDEGVVRGRAAQVRAALPGLPMELLDEAGVRAVEPAIGPGVWALRLPIGFPVVPSAPTYAWAARADRAGVVIRLGREARLVVSRGRAEAVDVGGERLGAAAVVVAAGPWTCELVDPSGRWRPIRPSWGVVVETVLANPPRHVLEEAAMDVALGSDEPADDPAGGSAAAPGPKTSVVTAAGASAIGSTFLDAEPDLDAWTEPILRRAVTFVPGLLEAPIRETRACARPLSADGRPLVGAVAWLDGVLVCSGHGPWGLTTGPASARQVADLVLGRRPTIDPAFDPGRFGGP
jgi:glycine/D-amino acid oxidase-like deaminating enzyme